MKRRRRGIGGASEKNAANVGAPTKAQIKDAEKTIPDMPKKGEASHFLGAKIYLAK